jgi:hypothetical protein
LERGGYGADALIDLRRGKGLPVAGTILGQHGAIAASVRDGEEDVVKRLQLKHAPTNVSEEGARCK